MTDEAAQPEKARAPQPKVTPFLVGMNVTVFIAMLVRGASPIMPRPDQLIDFGANLGALSVVQHEWWRAFTCMFVHIGVLHLAVNMYSLWAVGSFVERLLGAPKLLVMYLLTGLAGSFTMMIWDPLGISAGASAAIFGLFGVIVGYTFRARDKLPPDTFAALRLSIVVTFVFSLVFAVTMPNIGNAAHLGGLCAGILSGVTATSSALDGTGRATWGSQLIVLAAVVGLAVLADTYTKSRKNLEWELDRELAVIADSGKRFDEAVKLATRALERQDDPLLREARGEAYLFLGEYEKAVVDLRKGKKDEAGSKNALAWALVRLNEDLDEALSVANAAVVSLGGENQKLGLLQWQQRELLAPIYGTRCWVHVRRNELNEARQDCERAVQLEAPNLLDLGMLRYIEGDRAGALVIWQIAAAADASQARDLEPWLQLAKAP